jgi:DNA modification methylase
MAIKDKKIGDQFAIYNGDCVQVMKELPDNCVDLSIYSPTFAGLYVYSRDPEDMSNSISYDEFMKVKSSNIKRTFNKTRFTARERYDFMDAELDASWPTLPKNHLLLNPY